jgi:hypothetical protein
VLFVVAVVVPIVLAGHYGSLQAAGSDDWAYDLSTFHLANHGGFDLYHWGANSLVGQFVLAAPVVRLFGDSITALNVFTCFIGLAGLLALVSLGRQLRLSRPAAVFTAAVIGLGPMWSGLSTTFMSDIPSMSFMSMSFAVAGSDRRTDRLLTSRSVCALLLGGVAFTMRYEAVVVVPVIALCRLWRCGRPRIQSSLPWVGVVGLLAITLIGFYEWRQALPTGGTLYYGAAPLSEWWYSQWLFPLIGLMLAPVAVFVHPVATVREALRTRRTWTLVGWAVMPLGPAIVGIGVTLEQLPAPRSVGTAINHLAPSFGNGYFNLTGPAGPIIPAWALLLLGVVSIASLTVIVASIVLGVHHWLARARPTAGPADQAHYVAVMLTLVVAATAVVTAEGIRHQLLMWDRYIIAPVAYLALLVIYVASRHRITSPQRRTQPKWPLACLAGLAAINVLATIPGDALLGEEWNYSNHFAAGLPPSQRTLLFTEWTWSSMQHQQFIWNPSYARWPLCWIQVTNQPRQQGDVDYIKTGTWVQHYTFAMTPGPGSGNQACKT